MKKSVAISLVAAVAILSTFILVRVYPILKTQEKLVQKSAAQKPLVKQAGTPVVSTFQEGMGGITVKLLNSKNEPKRVLVRLFRQNDGVSLLEDNCQTNVMKQMRPGTYDIVMDTTPQTLIKDIVVRKGQETIKDLGSITGSLMIKILDANNNARPYSVNIMAPGSSSIVVSGVANRSIDLASGPYDVMIATVPKLFKKDVKIEKGKEELIDLGCASGFLTVKALDSSKKERRLSASVKYADTGAMAATVATSGMAEFLKGTYDIELFSNPSQKKKGVLIEPAKKQVVEFKVKDNEGVLVPQSANKTK